MKKFNYLILGLAGLTMASCSNDDLQAPGGDGNFKVTVKLPGDLATRAMSDGLTADKLQVAVYDANNGNALVTTADAEFGNALETTVYLNLTNGKTYNIAFFAQSEASMPTEGVENSGVYVFDAAAKTMTVHYENMLSDNNLADDYDCFYQLHNTGVVSNSNLGATVTLYRPVAQINWGTDDLDEDAIKDQGAFGNNGEYILTNLTTTAYTTLSLLDNDVTGDPEPVEIKALAAPVNEVFPVYIPETVTDPTTGETTEVNSLKYVAMQFVLAPKDVALFDLNLDINNGGNKKVQEITNDIVTVHSAPLQANYRTNIYGSLLTNPNVFTVVKDPNWYKPDYDISFFNVPLDGLTSITESGTYHLTGTAESGKSYKINVKAGIDVVIDGSDLESGEDPFSIYLDNGLMGDSPNQINSSERSGSIAVQNFTASVLSVKCGNTSVSFTNNNVEYIDLGASNVAVNVSGNTVDAMNTLHKRWDNGNSDNCVYLYMINYDLTFVNNTLTNAVGGPMMINGWTLNGNPGFYGEDLLGLNKIGSFSGNSMEMSATPPADNPTDLPAFVSFLGDGSFYLISTGDFTPAFKTLYEMVENGNNVFTLTGDAQEAYTLKCTMLNEWTSEGMGEIQ